MRRWLGLVCAWVGLVSLLLSVHYGSRLNYDPHRGWDRSARLWRDCNSSFARVLLAMSSELIRSRAGPVEYFATHSQLLPADAVGPPWLHHRGPPGVVWAPPGKLKAAGDYLQLQARGQKHTSTGKISPLTEST
jgi:hypothetical protein